MIKKLKNKFMEWYTKPRYGKLFDFSVWVLENPQALTIALIMGMCLGSVMFLSLLIFSIIKHWFPLFPVLFGVLFIIITRMAYKNIMFMRKTGSAFENLNIKTIMGAKGMDISAGATEDDVIIVDPNKKETYEDYSDFVENEVPNYEENKEEEEEGETK